MKTLFDLIQDGKKSMDARQFHPYFDSATYINESLFDRFKKSKDQVRYLKLIWAFGNTWRIDPFELVKICPDFCPVFGTPLDYGRGKNRLFDPNIVNSEGFYQPTIDHKVARINEGSNEIGNIVIVSRKANQFKSDMDSREVLDAFYKGMKATYYSS